MVEKKAALAEIVSDNWYVSFWSVNEHMKGKDRMLRSKRLKIVYDKR